MVSFVYRGFEGPYDPTRTMVVGASGVDFTDCPLTALMYAVGRRGTVLVVDVEEGTSRVSEELWLNQGARRFMFWGSSFKDLVVAQLPASELRAQVRRRGIVTASPPEKAMVAAAVNRRSPSGVPVRTLTEPLSNQSQFFAPFAFHWPPRPPCHNLRVS